MKKFIVFFLLSLIALLPACTPVDITPLPVDGTPRSATPVADSGTPQPSATAMPTNTKIAPTTPPHLMVLPADLNGVEITFSHPWTGAMGSEIENMVADFNMLNDWGIRAEVISAGGRSLNFESTIRLLDSGEAPNLVAASLEEILSIQERSRAVIDLNDYVSSPDWGLTDSQSADFSPTFWMQDEIDGRRYGLPAVRNGHVLFYNQTWAQELGFSKPPASPEEFKEQACEAAGALRNDTTAANDGTGGWFVSTDAYAVLSWLIAFEADPLPAEDSAKYRFNQPQARAAFNFLREMYDENCAWTGRQPTPYDYFATRRALFYSGSLDDLRQQKDALALANSGDEWSVLPYPSNEGQPVVILEGESYAVLAAEKNEQLAAWLLARWLSQPENQSRLAKAGFRIPAGVSAVSQMADFRQQNPQWAQALLWPPLAQSMPALASWRAVQPVLEDAAWQMFQSNYVTPEQVPGLLIVLDATIPDVIEHGN